MKEAGLQRSVLTNRNHIRRLSGAGKATHHVDAYNQQNQLVDVAAIDRRIMLLPGEVSIATGWHNGEVSRFHSSCRKRAERTVMISKEVSQHNEGRNVALFQYILEV